MGSLQDALLESGLASDEQQPKSGRSRKRDSGKSGRGGGSKRRARDRRGGGNGPGSSDLERAWAARRRAEKAEKERIRQARLADQEARRKRNLELDRIVEGQTRNLADAELPRYFEHLGRIRRVLCTSEQRDSINSGELGIVNLRGRYLIVETEVLERYRAVAPDLVPDLSGAEPDDETGGEYPPVPDDITW